ADSMTGPSLPSALVGHQSRTSGFPGDIGHLGNASDVTSADRPGGRTLMDVDEYARRGRRWGLFFAVGYLVFLVQPAYAQLTAPEPPTTRAAVLVALTVFIAIYLGYWTLLAFERSLTWQSVALLAALCAIAVGLARHDPGWTWAFIYCVVVAG